MKYYVYFLKDNNKIFYVGKGTRRRMYDHVRNAKSTTKNNKLLNKIRKVIFEGREIQYEKVFFTDSAIEAYEKEQEIIKSIGLDNLTNLTLGGEGMLGYTVSETHRKNISIAVKKAIEEGRFDLRKNIKNRKMTEKYKIKLSESLKKYWDNPELRIKQSEYTKAHPFKRTYTAESLKKMSEAGKRGNEIKKQKRKLQNKS